METKPTAKKFDWQADSSAEQDADTAEKTSLAQDSDESSTLSESTADRLLNKGAPDTRDVPEQRHLSVIGQTLRFKGDLCAEEDLLIQGQVKGTIRHRAKNLTIGAHGDVNANIVAQNVIIQGKVQGEIRATESVVVEPSARIVGDIFAPRVGLKEGAKFKGSIDMDADPAAETTPQAGRKKAAKKSTSKKSSASNKSENDTLSASEIDEVLD
jgi:cytoskeletal protein CcmA (bactofilin family)